jgi:hypothetical protein
MPTLTASSKNLSDLGHDVVLRTVGITSRRWLKEKLGSFRKNDPWMRG